MLSLVHIQSWWRQGKSSKFGNIYMFVIRNRKSFIPQILKFVSPLGKKFIYFSPLGFEIQKNYDSETSEFKLHSFRTFQWYLTDKIPTHSRGTASIFHSSLDMHDAVHTMMTSDITISAWLIDFCHKAI